MAAKEGKSWTDTILSIILPPFATFRHTDNNRSQDAANEETLEHEGALEHDGSTNELGSEHEDKRNSPELKNLPEQVQGKKSQQLQSKEKSSLEQEPEITKKTEAQELIWKAKEQQFEAEYKKKLEDLQIKLKSKEEVLEKSRQKQETELNQRISDLKTKEEDYTTIVSEREANVKAKEEESLKRISKIEVDLKAKEQEINLQLVEREANIKAKEEESLKKIEEREAIIKAKEEESLNKIEEREAQFKIKEEEFNSQLQARENNMKAKEEEALQKAQKLEIELQAKTKEFEENIIQKEAPLKAREQDIANRAEALAKWESSLAVQEQELNKHPSSGSDEETLDQEVNHSENHAETHSEIHPSSNRRKSKRRHGKHHKIKTISKFLFGDPGHSGHDNEEKPSDITNISGPMDVQHNACIIYTPESGFDITHLPTEWRTILDKAGVTDAEFQDEETAMFIMNFLTSKLNEQLKNRRNVITKSDVEDDEAKRECNLQLLDKQRQIQILEEQLKKQEENKDAAPAPANLAPPSLPGKHIAPPVPLPPLPPKSDNLQPTDDSQPNEAQSSNDGTAPPPPPPPPCPPPPPITENEPYLISVGDVSAAIKDVQLKKVEESDKKPPLETKTPFEAELFKAVKNPAAHLKKVTENPEMNKLIRDDEDSLVSALSEAMTKRRNAIGNKRDKAEEDQSKIMN